MKGLIIREPWISKILSGKKTWELRSRPTDYRGKIALIRKGTGMIVGLAELTDCLPPLSSATFDAARDRHGIPPDRDNEVIRAGWVFPWVMSGVRIIDPAIAAQQKPGAVIWVTLPARVVAEVENRDVTLMRGAA